MPIRQRVGEIALVFHAMATALAVMFALLTWYAFDWTEEARFLMWCTLCNSSLALVSLVIVVCVPRKFDTDPLAPGGR